jgi:hypothetical protein
VPPFVIALGDGRYRGPQVESALWSALAGDQSKLLNDRKPLAVILILHAVLLQRITHFMECNERKGRHPLFLFVAEGLIERLPRIGEFS